MSKNKTLAIVGGGASCVLLLANLARMGAAFEKITVFDRAGAFAKGVAYSTTHPAHLLNVRAANMSGFVDDKDHLVNWLARNEPQYSPADFIPRMVYARYLQSLFDEALNQLPVELVEQDVKSVTFKSGTGYTVQADEGAHFDDVVIATGNVRPLTIESDAACKIYSKSPYGIDYKAVRKNGHIVIIGTGLSGVDAIVALVEEGFEGQFTVISKNGWFPASHAVPQVWEAMEGFLHQRSVACWMKQIRSYVRKAEEAGLFWQTAIDSLRAQTNPIWEGLTQRQRDIFMRHGLSAWNIHRHRMAPENAKTIQDLKLSGRLNSVRDRAVRIHEDGAVLCRCGELIQGADMIINALGYRYDEKGRDYESSYRIGPARFGELFETTAMPEIRAQAFDIANKLIQ